MVAFCVAFLCAILSAWGVGGGTVLLLVMTLVLEVEQQAAQGINLLFFLPSATAALWNHHKQGFLHTPTLRTAIPWGVVGALIGAWVATGVDIQALRKPFGVYLLLAGVSLLWPKRD